MEEVLHYHRRYVHRMEVVLARYSLMWLKVLQVQVELVLLVGVQPDVYLFTDGHILHSQDCQEIHSRCATGLYDPAMVGI